MPAKTAATLPVHPLFLHHAIHTHLVQLACDVAKFSLLQLGLPEHWVRIREAVLHPAFFLDMVQVDETTRVGIAMRSRQDASPTKLQGILNAQVIVVLGVQNTIRKCLAGPNAEQVPREPGAVAVDVVQRGALLLGHASAHGAHAESHALVAVDQVGEDLAGGCDADAAFVPELVEAALHAEPGQPVLAVGGTAGHGAQQDAVDLDDLLDRLRGNPVASRGAGVSSDDDATLETEGERCRAVSNLDGTVGI